MAKSKRIDELTDKVLDRRRCRESPSRVATKLLPGLALAITILIVVQSLLRAVRPQAKPQLPADAKIEWIYGYRDNQGFDYFENYAAFPSKERLPFPEKMRHRFVGLCCRSVSKIAVVP